MGAGNDLIDGGEGDDEMTGGDGEDVFRVERDSGTDVIVDFTRGADKIDVSAFEITSFAQLTVDGDTIEFDDGSTLVVLNADLLTEEELIF
jgi:Ca2+-binding RTX toxin-like protein